MVVIICFDEETAKEHFAGEIKVLEEKGEKVFFLTPNSNNERLKSCNVNAILLENTNILEHIPEIKLILLSHTLRQKEGNYKAFWEKWKPKNMWSAKPKVFNEEKDKAIFKMWIDEQTVEGESLESEKPPLFRDTTKEYDLYTKGSWDFSKPKE